MDPLLKQQMAILRMPFHERVPATIVQMVSTFANAPVFEREVKPVDGRTATISSSYFTERYQALMFGSNNYLDMAHDPRVMEAATQAIAEYGVSMTGSMVLNGRSPVHRQLELAIADLKDAQDAIVLSSGFLANVGWVRAFVRRQDAVIYDDRSHTSFLEGLRATDCETRLSFAHNDLADFHRVLEKARAAPGDVYVFTEGLFSMDGDVPPLREIASACEAVGAILVVDDAHGTGVLGSTGKGIAQHVGLTSGITLTVGTLSKALGCVGGFITGSSEVIFYLRRHLLSNVFTASLSPPITAACLKSIEILKQEPERVDRLAHNSAFARQMLSKRYNVVDGWGPIIPIRFGPGVDIQRLAFDLLEEGIFVNCAIFPAVPLDSPRLRVTVATQHTEADILHLVESLDRVVERHGIVPVGVVKGEAMQDA